MCSKLEKPTLFLTILSLQIVFCPSEKILPPPPHFSSLSRARLALAGFARNPNFLIAAHSKAARGKARLCQLTLEGSGAQVVPVTGEHPLLPQPLQRDGTCAKRFYVVSAWQGTPPRCKRQAVAGQRVSSLRRAL